MTEAALAVHGTSALVVRDLGKHYALPKSHFRRLVRQLSVRGAPPRTGGLWAVRNVAFSLDRGQSLGVIGSNGAGKSTLLRLIAGIARPSEGSVERRASVASLLDLGVGFHPLETGRENAEAALVLQAGMSRREARARLAEVAAFADIGQFFDRPIRIYSEGMRLRLGFAVATLLEPDVLVTDEILSVGDEGFQRRCDRWLDRFMSSGGTLVLCSHDLSQVQRLCARTLWIDHGRPRDMGESRAVIRAYRDSLGGDGRGTEAEGVAGRSHAPGERTHLPFEVVALRLQDEAGVDTTSLPKGATVLVTVDLHAPAGVPQLFVGITRHDLTPVYGLASDMDGAPAERIDEEHYRYRIWFSDLPLAPERYRLRAHALDETGTRLYDTVEIFFEVVGGRDDGGLVHPVVHWQPASSAEPCPP
ncbi:MAG: ABC transporter ATP-binding protein [Gemmatimonadetes bacterium]|nr:ABC transporter ATP-binding protein [Gemmatimonadota bacterium]